MSILKQLSLLVGVMAISFISIVWVSIAKLDEVYTTTNYASTESIPSMLLLTDEINHISVLRAQAFKYQLLDTPQKRAKLEKLAIQKVKSLKKVFDKYEKLNLTPKGRELLAADKKDAANYINLVEKIRSLTKAGKVEEANSLMMHEHKTLVQKLIATVNKHNKYNSQLALEHAEMAKKAKNSADKFLIIFVTVVVLFALLLSLFSIKNILTAINTIKEKIAYFVQEKDLNMKIEYRSNNEFKEIVESLNSLIGTLKTTIVDAKHSAMENAAVSHELSTTSELIDKNSKQSTEIVSNAINEVKSVQSFIEETARISETTKTEILEVSEKLAKSKDEIVTLKENISSASEAESEMSMKLDDLSRDAEQVKEVLSVISDIADQTNLLALNAAIEAARAGEHGRGFAVVADEVRKLAERTQKSLLEITASINVIVQSITEAASQMEQNAKNIQNLTNISSEVENTVLETNSVMQESISSVDSNAANSLKIAKDADRIVRLVSDINDMTNQNAKSVEEISSAADNLSELSEGVQGKLEEFKS